MIRKIINITLIVLAILCASVVLFFLVFKLVNQTNGVMISSGDQRRYLLFVPDSYHETETPVPLVVAIHGYSEWAKHMEEVSHWNSLADENGFIVVYPSGSGIPLHWATSGFAKENEDPLRDVMFISDLVDTLLAEYKIDPERVYVNGFSNGGGMSFLASCHLSSKIAAIGSVAGAYMTDWDVCTPERAVPAILFHGTEDPVVPYHGGPSRSFDLPFPEVPRWVDILAERNGCTQTFTSLEMTENVSGIQYSGCAADVVFYTVQGGGHAWVGGKALPEWIIGYTSAEIDATRLMWEFFSQHKLDGE